MNNIYLYQNNGEYVAFDKKSMSFYSIPRNLGDEISSLDSEEKEILFQKVFKQNDNIKIQTDDLVSAKKCKRLILVITQFCNLACKYCYADAGTYGNQCKSKMTLDTAKNAINRMVEMFPNGISLIQFFGGEPLLNYTIIKDVCLYCEELVDKGILKEMPKFAVVSNGTIMNSNIINILNNYNINVTISLDGPKSINDNQRVFPNSNQSVYENIMRNLDLLNSNRRFPLSIEITLTQSFIELSETQKLMFLDLLTNKRVDSIHIVPVITNEDDELNIIDDSKLKKAVDLITEYSLNSMASSNPMFIFKAVDFLSFVVSRHCKENFCTAGISNFAIDTQGDIYGCFMLINPGKELCMGNVNDDNFSREDFLKLSDQFRNVKYDNIDDCKGCVLKGFCSNCVAASYNAYGSLEKPIHNSCVAQLAMFEKIGYYMANNNIHK